VTENPIGLTRKVIKPVSNFFSSPVAGGIVLIIASAAAHRGQFALREGYETLLKYKTAGLSVEHWINDALMAVFFMMVGLEIKRELVTGQLHLEPACVAGLCRTGWSGRTCPDLRGV
jgi:NhaA family Na+:H+ antiporter